MNSFKSLMAYLSPGKRQSISQGVKSKNAHDSNSGLQRPMRNSKKAEIFKKWQSNGRVTKNRKAPRTPRNGRRDNGDKSDAEFIPSDTETEQSVETTEQMNNKPRESSG